MNTCLHEMLRFATSPSATTRNIVSMFGVELLCSDETCADVVEAVGGLDELSRLACEGCGATYEVISVWEVTEERLAPLAPPIDLDSRRRRAAQRRAA